MSIVEADYAIGAILPYFGGKRTMAHVIVEELGPHHSYWEPFCGSMAVLLGKPSVRSETVNDLHGDLINLARVIQHSTEGPRFYRQLRRTWVSEQLFKEAAGRLWDDCGDDLDVVRAIDYFTASWLGRNGTAGTKIGQKRGAGYSFCVRFTSGGGDPSTRWKGAIESIPGWRKRLRNVTILKRDAFEILSRIEDEEGTVIYVDSPYLAETRSGFNGKGGTSHYRHEFAPGDHARLAEAVRHFKRTRVVVSYYDHPSLDDLYSGWTKRHIKASKAIANVAKRDKGGSTDAPEVLLVNGPSFGAKAGPATLF